MITDHHAYLCHQELSRLELSEYIKSDDNISEIDFWETQTLKISEVRDIINRAYTRPLVGSHKVMVIKAGAVNIEAQQALLKILEEAPVSTIFIFLLTKDCNLLPTLRSRFLSYEPKVHEDVSTLSTDTEAVSEFLDLEIKERLNLISDRLSKSDSNWVDNIKKGLACKLSSEVSQFDVNVLTRLNMIIMNLNSRGASNKMLLEELALTLR